MIKCICNISFYINKQHRKAMGQPGMDKPEILATLGGGGGGGA
jgi:hypothetical protein